MEINANGIVVTNHFKTRTLLFVADFVTGNPDVLDFACELAVRQEANLQLLHVIDLEHTHSSPDAQMGAQYSLETLAQRARALKTSAVSLLSFGRPEIEIPRRAAEVNASLVVLPLNGSAADHLQKKLVRRLTGKCNCPVLAVPCDLFLVGNANTSLIRSLLSLFRQDGEEDRQSIKNLAPASVERRSQAPLPIMPKPAHFLKRQRA